MNDISVKIEETPKEQVRVEPLVSDEQANQNEIDPLALDEGDTDKKSDPSILEKIENTEPIKAESCDENNAKESEVNSEKGIQDETIALQSEIKEQLLVEDNSSIKDTPDVTLETVALKEVEAPVNTEPAEPSESNESTPVELTTQPELLETTKTLEKVEVNESVALNEPTPTAVQTKKTIEEKNVDVEMTEVKEDKTEKVETKSEVKPVNGDCTKEEATKRRSSEELETEAPLKKLRQEVEKTFTSHDSMINEYMQTATKNNIDEIQRHTEQLLAEIQTLRELAQKKEHEWNNILHLKKVKEEILLRLLRRKQVLSFEKSVEINGTDRPEPFDYLNQPKSLAIDKSDEISGVAIKQPGSTMNQTPGSVTVTTHFTPVAGLPPPYDKAAHMHNMPKNMYPAPIMLPGPQMTGFPRDMNGQMTSFGMPIGRQGPTKDVKSIIADYRQRNPDATPRRGRRMKSILNPNMMNPPRLPPPKIDNMNNMNNLSNLGMIFNNLDMNQKAMLERLSQMQTTSLPNGLSFKDVLVQFANMHQQPNPGLMVRPEMMPNRPMDPPQIRPNETNWNANRRMEKPTSTYNDGDMQISVKQCLRHTSASPRLPLPPPYPEISLLPVSSTSQEPCSAPAQENSLLHGILTKQGNTATRYSPTLAKLLTSPERKQTPTLPTFGQAKNCGEITITPVQVTAPPPEQPAEKSEEVVQLDDEESPASDGEGSALAEGEERRLVIDEGSAGGSNGTPNGGGEETPLCQGCKRQDAQFVCAGCANQWYCSRDCQVAAWDDHSDMCSG